MSVYRTIGPLVGILVPMNFRNSGEMLLILVREFWNLVIEKSVKSQGILLFMICGNPVKQKQTSKHDYDQESILG